MDASEKATILAGAVSEGINCVAYIRSLRAEAHVANSGELSAWREAIDRAESGFAEMQLEVAAGRAQTSILVTSDLLSSLEDVRAHLSMIAPGAQLPAALFDRVEVAWSELAKAMS